MNGRIDANNTSNFTCFTTYGNSVVDYDIAMEQFFENISNLIIGDINEVSDHVPVQAAIKADILNKMISSQSVNINTDEVENVTSNNSISENLKSNYNKRFVTSEDTYARYVSS